MHYRWIENIEEFRDISAEWDKTLAASDGRNPFLLSDFIITWWRYFKDISGLRILAIFDNESLVGGIPLCLRRGKGIYGFARVLSYVGGTAANYTEPLCVSSQIKISSLIEEALSDRRDWDFLYLPDIKGQNRIVNEYATRPNSRRYDTILIQDHMDWSIDLSCGQEKFLENISWKLKKDLRAKRKHISKKFGYISLREIHGKEDVGRYFDIYTKFSLNAFTERNRRSSMRDCRYVSFLRDLMITMDKNRRLAAYVLSAGDRVMAVSFGYRSDAGFDWALTGFDYELKYFRPGYIMMEELIKDICGRGETYCNMYGHERFYKSQWSNSQAPLYKLLLMRHTLAGSLCGVLQRLEKVLRSSPAMVKLARRLKRA